MTPQEAIAYIETGIWSTMRLGLDRTYELLDLLGNPQKKLKFIHVAGSNGKGSTCAMLDEILHRAGYRTGLYTSPYILSFCERMRVNGEDIPGERLAEVTEKVRALAESMEDHPSQFEMVTAIALEYFYQSGCDIVVLEVGLGGETDSTNAIDAPEVAVITNIGLEHTEYLGDTLEKIAAVKGGIIKTGCHAVCYDGAPEVSATIAKVLSWRSISVHAAYTYAFFAPGPRVHTRRRPSMSRQPDISFVRAPVCGFHSFQVMEGGNIAFHFASPATTPFPRSQTNSARAGSSLRALTAFSESASMRSRPSAAIRGTSSRRNLPRSAATRTPGMQISATLLANLKPDAVI